MSRIDESDRQAQRAAERLAQEKRQSEERLKKTRQGESAFARLVQQGQAQQGTTQDRMQQLYRQPAAESPHEEQAATGRALEDPKQEARARDRARKAGRSFTEKLHQPRPPENERRSDGRVADQGQQASAAEGRGEDARTAEGRAQSRRADAKTGNESLRERGEASLLPKAHPGAAAQGKQALETGEQGGQKGGQNNPQDSEGGARFGGGFRFNPALLAPVPVARPRDNAGSERLRRIANEIAQKIVERVRVGTNAAGAAEFQIDLRSDVLSGLSIKVSGGKGKIKLVFSGGDKQVLEALSQGAEGLKQTLSGRGLEVAELRIEERA